MAEAVYITASLDLQIKADTDPAASITILDSNSVAYDFSNKTDSDLNIYDYEGGNLVKNYGESATEGLSYASNVITWNAAYPATILPAGMYYYEITYEDSVLANPTQKICDGSLEVI
jgi:hypothetical protein